MRIAAVVISLAVLAGCGGSHDDDPPEPPRVVVAGFYPLAWAAERVAADSFDELVNLTPPGVEPHDLELAPNDVETVRDAYFVLYVGSGFQPALEDAVAETDGRTFDILRGQRGDPHVWLDPRRFALIVQQIAERLGGAESAHGEIRALRGLDAEFRRGLARCKRRTFVTTHAAFDHLAERYDLEQLALAGASPEAEPSPRELEGLIDDVRASGATTVFTEPLVSDRVAETVARETGADLAVLDPLEGLSEERLAAGEDYLSVMRDNLAALREALGCR